MRIDKIPAEYMQRQEVRTRNQAYAAGRVTEACERSDHFPFGRRIEEGNFFSRCQVSGSVNPKRLCVDDRCWATRVIHERDQRVLNMSALIDLDSSVAGRGWLAVERED